MSEVSFLPQPADTSDRITLGDQIVGKHTVTVVMPDGHHGDDPANPGTKISVELEVSLPTANVDLNRSGSIETNGDERIDIEFEITSAGPGGFEITVFGSSKPGLAPGSYEVEFQGIPAVAIPPEPEVTGTARIIPGHDPTADVLVGAWPPRPVQPVLSEDEQKQAKAKRAKELSRGKWHGLALASLFLIIPTLMVTAIALAAYLFG